MRVVLSLVTVLVITLAANAAHACFTPIWKLPKSPDAKSRSLLLEATTAIVAWDDERMTTTLVPKLAGDIRKFSLIIPVAGKLKKKDLKVLKDEVHFQLLAASEPRLRTVRDYDPCFEAKPASLDQAMEMPPPPAAAGAPAKPKASAYGVSVDAHFEVGEYDLALLSAKNAEGLGRWLRRFKYEVDEKTEAEIGKVLGRGMRLLVARVHLKKLVKERFTSLRPLQIRSGHKGAPRLPLAIAAASGVAHDVVVLTLGAERTRVSPHRMLKLDTDSELPSFVNEDNFDVEYLRMVGHAFAEQAGAPAALLEFAGPAPTMKVSSLGARPGAFMTRWRVRVTPGSADLEIADDGRDRYQTELVARETWAPAGLQTCPAGRSYMRQLKAKLADQARAYESLTGVPADETEARLLAEHPKATLSWAEKKKDLEEVKEVVLAADEPGFLDDWWKLALGLFAFVVGLIVIGRIRRG